MKRVIGLFLLSVFLLSFVMAASSTTVSTDFIVVDPEPEVLRAIEEASSDSSMDNAILESLGWIVFVLIIFIILRKIFRILAAKNERNNMYESVVTKNSSGKNHAKHKILGIPKLKVKNSSRKKDFVLDGDRNSKNVRKKVADMRTSKSKSEGAKKKTAKKKKR